eukprot:TRINITY_DN40205_c0_g1_i1.p1 TRINITY_DN40205_c0_g1~~TRINITY_DN40205_c0_g1_i1.p1  ORF type:complete len:282 (-),score=64.17 TRINITY_DN40205_c0_g1_i1:44-826(-)
MAAPAGLQHPMSPAAPAMARDASLQGSLPVAEPVALPTFTTLRWTSTTGVPMPMPVPATAQPAHAYYAAGVPYVPAPVLPPVQVAPASPVAPALPAAAPVVYAAPAFGGAAQYLMPTTTASWASLPRPRPMPLSPVFSYATMVPAASTAQPCAAPVAPAASGKEGTEAEEATKAHEKEAPEKEVEEDSKKELEEEGKDQAPTDQTAPEDEAKQEVKAAEATELTADETTTVEVEEQLPTLLVSGGAAPAETGTDKLEVAK